MSEKPAPENIERAREARQESFRTALTESAKAQQEASSVTFAMASESGRGWDPDAHLIPIAKAIAAAEERGRRKGVEERTRLRRALLKISAGSTKSGFHWGEVKRIADAALAPRAQASDGPPCANCKHEKFWHQWSSKEHAFCCSPVGGDYCGCKNYLAPRDSAPAAHVCECKGDSTAQFWDGGHLPDCPVVAPRKDRP